MPTFDVVSKIDLAEVSNAVSNLLREIEQRYDFKGSHCEVVLNKDTITVNADDDLKLRPEKWHNGQDYKYRCRCS